jgi:hypothetical protein
LGGIGAFHELEQIDRPRVSCVVVQNSRRSGGSAGAWGRAQKVVENSSEKELKSSSRRREVTLMPAKSHLEIVVPTGENRAVLPQRRRNAEYRQREHLTPSEVAKLIETAKRNRYGQRDATMILVAIPAWPTGFRNL